MVFLRALLIHLFLLSSVCFANDVVITVYGSNEQPPVSLTEEEIRTLPSVSITTFDPWDNKERKYKGCTISDLLKKLGYWDDMQLIEIIAKNDYKATITRTEMTTYQYLLSYEMDGVDYSTLGEDNKGPLVVAVEMEKISNPDKTKVKNQLVWWIEKLVVK